jgi:hypothetical protein
MPGMKHYLQIFLGMVAVLPHIGVLEAQAQVGIGAESATEVCRSVRNPTGGNFLSGKFFEARARGYLDKHDTTGALAAFEHAAYYGNKDAQFEIAMMRLKGAGKIPIDVPLGIAWLRIASKYGHSPSVNALQKLEPELTPDQREASIRDFQNLEGKYGVAATRSRVMNTYQLERGHSAFSQRICQDGVAMPTDKYLAQVDQEFTDYVSEMYGKVTVEPLQPISTPDN